MSGKENITAEVVLDSVSPQALWRDPYTSLDKVVGGHRLTTMVVRYPKMVHGEFMTHRVFGRNASSSRAIPTERLVRENLDNMYVPTFVRNQRGMQGGDELPPAVQALVGEVWKGLGGECAVRVRDMAECGVHKQHANRPLEWFGWIKVLVTATEYMNFFGLRLDSAAQPEIRFLAEAMWRSYNESEPKLCCDVGWHLPFYEPDQDGAAVAASSWEGDPFEVLRRISAARSARISYASFETGKRSTVEDDLAVYDKLVVSRPMHLSPLEHQAMPDTGLHWHRIGHTDTVYLGDHYSQWGCYTGWRQYRKMIPGESVAPLPEAYR